MLTRIVLLLAVLPLLIACGKSRSQVRISVPKTEARITFPQGFLWGTATAAEQLEPTEDSDWAELIRKS
ncbi:MAG TPA: hypothetical protein PLF85_09575, partial [Turneriella sp.]|nr:hypothetical protein [Turneriella sp.]